MENHRAEGDWTCGDQECSYQTNSKANLESPTFTGTPKASTAALNTNTIQIATTAFVANALGALTSDTGSLGLQSADNVSISGGTITGITDLAVADGGTGASTATDARTNLGVPPLTGTGTSGTWPISITGNAATVSSISTAVVTAALAGTAVNTVGSYAFLTIPGTVNPGTTITGGKFAGVGGGQVQNSNTTGAGTWRSMGFGTSTTDYQAATVFLRIV